MLKSHFRSLALVLTVTLLAGCASQRWVPDEDQPPVDDRGVVDERVRAPAADEARGLQVYPLRNPAVTELTEAAAQAERDGDLDRAANLLERALRIEPRDPELLQNMAEIRLAQGNWEQADSYSRRSFDVGPRVGALCQRNWRTIALARERMQQLDSAREARDRLSACQVEPPPRM